MENQDYAQSIAKDSEGEQRAREAMAKYGDNHWWESADLRTQTYYQLHEDIWLLPYTTLGPFRKALGTLLGRSVSPHEIVYTTANLKAEARAAWEGHSLSEEEKRQKEQMAAHLFVEHTPITIIEL